MREILFRGKNIETGEWVYGTPIYQGNRAYIISGVVECNDEYISIENWDEAEPETVGQFTGLTDKNGVKIFEGDVLTSYHDNSLYIKYKHEPVVFFNGCFGFKCTHLNIPMLQSIGYEFEVITNIHES